MIVIWLFCLLNAISCSPVRSESSGATDGRVRILSPLQYSESDYLVFLPDTGNLLMSNDAGISWISPKPFGVDVNFTDIRYTPGTKNIGAFNKMFYFGFSAGRRKPDLRSIDLPFAYSNVNGDEFFDLDIQEKDGGILSLMYNTRNALLHFEKGLKGMSLEASAENATQCAIDLFGTTGMWCVDRDFRLTRAAVPGTEAAPEVIFESDAKSIQQADGYVVALVGNLLHVLVNSDSTNNNTWSLAELPLGVERVDSIKEVGRGLNYSLEHGVVGPTENLWVVEYTADDGNRQAALWTAEDKGRRFIEQLQLSSPESLWRVSQVLYALDASKNLRFSVVNGHYWSDAQVRLDFDKPVISSARLSLMFKDEATLMVTYDGVEWSEISCEAISQGQSGDLQVMLADHGSLIIAVKGDEFWGWFNEWQRLDLPNELFSNKDETFDVFAVGTKLNFVNKAEGRLHGVNLRGTSTLTNLCTEQDVHERGGANCIMGFKRTIWDRHDDSQCFMGPIINTQYDACECVSVDSFCENFKVNNSIDSSAGSDEVAVTKMKGIEAKTKFFEEHVKDYLYLPDLSVDSTDETVLAWTDEGSLYVSQDQGSQWTAVNSVKGVINVFKSKTKDSQVYAFSSEDFEDNNVWVSWDRGRNFEQLKLPGKPSVVYSILPDVVTFHPSHPDWMLFSGAVDCDTFFDCPYTGFLSKDSGRTWSKIYDNALACQWVGGLASGKSEELVYCFTSTENKTIRVAWSTDYFASGTENTVQGISNIVDISVEQPFVFAAYVDEDDSVKGALSRDGVNFESLKYPPNVKSSGGGGLVLLKTDDKTVTIYEGNGGRGDSQFGSLIRSGGYGTNFVSILENVNRAAGVFDDYVDVDRMLSIEGVLVANVVSNPDDVVRVGAKKKIETYISHSNGAKWMKIPAPKGSCEDDECFLHLHGHSERLDMRNTPSSPSAVGIFFGRGNVGSSLGDLTSSQTYMTRDGGITWSMVSDRPMFWEFGDAGSILLLIDSLEPTNEVSYSVDEGETWQKYQFSESLIKVTNLATIPSDTSRKFIIFGKPPLATGSSSVAVQIDFSKLCTRKCKSSDFYWWTPSHPQFGDQCILGHTTKYLRRKPSSDCFIGKIEDQIDGHPRKTTDDCECDRVDYECDYGYVLDLETNDCKLLEGLKIPDRQSQCDGNAIAWHEVTGYRKLASSTCKSGVQLDKPQLYACPGKEKEFKEQFPNENAPSKPQPPSNATPSPDHPAPSSPSAPVDNGDLGRSLFARIFRKVFQIIFVVIFVSGLGIALILVNRHLESRGVSLSHMVKGVFGNGSTVLEPNESSQISSEAIGRVFEHAQSAALNVVSAVRYGLSKLPLVGSNHPYDHLAFYSRMDDEERMRILDSGDEFADEETDDAETHFDISNERTHVTEDHGFYDNSDSGSEDDNAEHPLL